MTRSVAMSGPADQLTDISPYLATLAALVISHRRRTRAPQPPAEVAGATPGETAGTRPQMH